MCAQFPRKDKGLPNAQSTRAILASKVRAQTMKAEATISAALPKPARMPRTRRTALLKALADPRRFELLECIARASCPLGCAQAHAALKIAPATLSHHIKELENAGLIDVTREGKFHYLKLKSGVLESLAETLKALPSGSCTSR